MAHEFQALMAGTDFVPLTREQYQDAVVAGVRERIKDMSWFRGVCTDCIDYHYPDVQAGIEAAELDTWFWDGMVPCEA